jgi:hypothetical protein
VARGWDHFEVFVEHVALGKGLANLAVGRHRSALVLVAEKRRSKRFSDVVDAECSLVPVVQVLTRDAAKMLNPTESDELPHI